MRFRGKSIRRKIVALLLVPLVSLTALWGFATVLTGREANQILNVSSVVENIGNPVADALGVMQKERRQTLIYLADRRASNALPALRERRKATDLAVATIKESMEDSGVRDDMRPESSQTLASLVESIDGLGALRRSVEAGTLSRDQALEFYNRIIDPGFAFLTSLHPLHEVDMERESRALVGLVRAMEMLSREDALISSALTAGRITHDEIRQLADFVAHRELYYDINLEALPAKERAIYDRFWTSPQTAPLRAAEEKLIRTGPLQKADASGFARWQEAATPVLDQLGREGRAAGVRFQDRVGPEAYSVFLRAGIAGVLGFLALLVSVIVSVRIGRDLVRDLSRLRKEAHEVSGIRLPSVMRRLAAGEHVDVETEAPRLEYDKDEVGQAGQALNSLQRAAIEAAVRQADMRRGVSEVFVNLARRNQVLLHRQLTLLDAMERRTEDTEELADLFRLDHLTTRMRRHAEGLVILSGAAPSRQWRKPIQLMDVVRAAVAEVEDYERIEVRRLPRIGVGGPSVADLTHLIAELLENATVFSPPHTGVQVHGERVANGFTLEIHDRGLGMAPDALLDANLRLAETPEFELSDTDRLGLFVVSRLAQRQNVRVSLQPSPYGGTTAVVFIPAALLTDAPETQGTGFRLDRKSESAAGRRAGEGKVSTLSKVPSPLNGSALLHGPVELEAPVGGPGFDDRPSIGRSPFDRAAFSRADTRADVDVDPDVDAGEDEGERGGIFRARPRDRRRSAADDGRMRPAPGEDFRRPGPHDDLRRPTSGEQHEQALDPAPATGPVPLPRRRPPTLVSDHGRRVGERGSERSGERGGERGGRAFPSAAPEPEHTVEPTFAPAPDALPGGPWPAPRPADGDRPGLGPAQLPRGAEPPAADGRPAPGELPRRVRQASLAPQLRENAAAAERPPSGDIRPDAERDAEQVRSRMASMQQGWRRGRVTNAAEATEADDADRTTGTGTGETAPRTTSEGDGR